MKKYLAIIMAAAMVLVLAACGNSGAKAEPEQEEQAATEEQQEPASGDGGTYSTIKEREPGATILDGFALKGGSAGTDSAEQDIKEWISSLGLE